MKVQWFAAATISLLCLPAFSQNVKLAKVALGMTEAEVREALAPAGMEYVPQASDSPGLQSLVAAKDQESYAFTFLDGRVVAYSVFHILPADHPSPVKAIRDSITKQTWAPVLVEGRSTSWLSDAGGAPVADGTKCAPAPAGGWVELKLTGSPFHSAAGLMKPSILLYPVGCGVSIHMDEASAGGDTDPVSAVSLQVLNMKAMMAFADKHAHTSR